MERQSNTIQNLPDTLSSAMRKMTDITTELLEPVMRSMTDNIGDAAKSLSKGKLPAFDLSSITANNKSDCCVPQQECPPKYLAQINRCAAAGERIVVSFDIENTCNKEKTYRVGIRPLTDLHGNVALTQPQLTKDVVKIGSGNKARVTFYLDLAQYNNGNTYTAEIVIREKEINQNVLFTLKLSEECNAVPVARPIEESKYYQQWHSWKSHFYCEKPRGRKIADPNKVVDIREEKKTVK